MTNKLKSKKLSPKTALILVDLQNDFMPGGPMGVKEGDLTINFANKLMSSKMFDKVVATKDWHPSNHKSFASNHKDKKVFDVISLNNLPQVLWPAHCVQNTTGAELHPRLNTALIDHITTKGESPEVDSYSGFMDNDKKTRTDLLQYLKQNDITEVVIMGLATDYCVKATAIDAAKLGFKTKVFKKGCKAVNLNPNDSDLAFEQMEKEGVDNSYQII